ncbi:MAG TPA: tRNA (uridine(34)/cytosine(34)/5-carboxymethylaminomethyluridine(34)-2'-O)-methyltransferase TrmL [Gammaproteobacteria bacterium]|nr:tRNA (uridine(34)/cytosine(34)/5-carboxymethylaminomethyluridine(34)-2'-O)-methyltransferase TrmL [Gammaproteobacteria bacterium]
MFNIILYQPEIPPNTGNIIRLSANIGATLHLIKPMGFELEDKALKRAGLDYHEFADIKVYENLDDCISALGKTRIFACSTKGQQNYAEINYQHNDSFLFGPETRGLPVEILEKFTVIKIPMQPNCRSLNLSNSVAVIVYEAWRQNKFL